MFGTVYFVEHMQCGATLSMKCLAAFGVLFLYVAGTLGQTIYDAYNFYKPMTDSFDVRHRGGLFLPECVKNLLNCWEVIRPDLVCKYGVKYRETMESICMDMRLQCDVFEGPQPFKTNNVTTWDYCAVTREEHDAIDRSPTQGGTNSRPPTTWNWWDWMWWG